LAPCHACDSALTHMQPIVHLKLIPIRPKPTSPISFPTSFGMLIVEYNVDGKLVVVKL
jgi:hypothetical protein